MPVLKDRKEDIPLLARAFPDKLNDENNQYFQLYDQCINQLSEYDWSGNDREILQAIQPAFILTDPAIQTVTLPTDSAPPFVRQDRKDCIGTQFGITIEEMLLKKCY